MSDDERDNDIESDADKRAHHNALERKRRDHIKDSFSMLRDALPFFQGDKEKKRKKTDEGEDQRKSKKLIEESPARKFSASRAQILKKAADYITTMRRKNIAHQQDIDDLKRQNKTLEEQIRLLEKARTPENIASATLAIESAKMTLKNIGNFHGPEYGDTSESEDSSDNSHDSNDNPRKRLKTASDPSRM